MLNVMHIWTSCNIFSDRRSQEEVRTFGFLACVRVGWVIINIEQRQRNGARHRHAGGKYEEE